jgi:FemAB-related protein (PEP-CTERM system-associated)
VNALSALNFLGIRTADLSDWNEVARIDRFVMEHPGAEPFHRPQWTKAAEAGCRQRGHILLAERRGELLGLLPLTEIRSRLFGSALVSTGFGIGGGILADDPQAGAALAAHALELADRLGCGSVELRGGPIPDGFTAQDGIYADFARQLPSDDAAILASIPRKQRAEVRKALDFGMTVSIRRDEADRQAHYAVYAESVRNLGTPVFPRALFDAMLESFGDDANIVTVRSGGRPVASVLSFYFKGCVYPYWGGGTQAARKLRANELVHYELMRHAAARGCTRFSFGRSKYGTGPYSYKKNWGFEPRPLTYAVRTLDGAVPRSVNPKDPKYRLQVALWRKLPLWLANRFGPVIARGLG